MTTVAVRARRWPALPALRLTDGAVEALKWLALLLMVADHVNKYLLQDRVLLAFDLGRMVMPIFAVVLGFNLARSVPGMIPRVALRLSLYGSLATVPFIALGGLAWVWWPLNIMATLLIATLVCWAFDSGRLLYKVLACILFLFAGSSVEFWWPGVALCIAAWSYARAPSWLAFLCGMVALVALRIVNGNDFALLTIPVLALATMWRRPLPRARHVFYALYPLHLAALWLLQRFA